MRGSSGTHDAQLYAVCITIPNTNVAYIVPQLQTTFPNLSSVFKTALVTLLTLTDYV